MMWSARMLRLGTILSPFLFIACADTDEPQALQISKVKLKVTVSYVKEEKHTLKFAVTNEGEPFEFNEAALPWHDRLHMRLICVDWSGAVLRGPGYTPGPVPGTMVLKRGETIEGSVTLESRCAGFLEANSKGDLDVFWSYYLSDVGKESNRSGGWVFIPKKGK